MSVIQVETQISEKQLLRAILGLTETKFQRLIKKATKERAKQPQRLSRRESELLQKINTGPALEVKSRYDNLYRKWQAGETSTAEYEELRQLNKQAEAASAEWLGHLADLARLRQKPLPVVMAELGIEPPADE